MGVLDITRLWRSPRALSRAREAALLIARSRLAERRRAAAVQTQVMADAHGGQNLLRLFRHAAPPILEAMPPGFRALEIGAGMAVFSSLLVAHGAGRVLATEILWAGETPFDEANAHTLCRLAEDEPRLRGVLGFDRQADGQVTRVRFDPRIGFARADAHALPVAPGSLDLVCSVNCLEHIPDVGRSFQEAARALRVGGMLFASTEPLWFSGAGHHVDEIFPLPWGHLLWEAEEFAEIVVREAGGDREWQPGEPLRPAHIVQILREEVNHASPAEIRRGLLAGPWQVHGWFDVADPADEALAREVGLREALRGVSAEALFLQGLQIWLVRTAKPQGLRWTLRLSHRTRRRLRRLIP
jgi:SAM-dependent methyltransferase